MKKLLIIFVAVVSLMVSCKENNINPSGGPVGSIEYIFPNPSENTVLISFSVIKSAKMKLTVENLTGVELFALDERIFENGNQMWEIDVSGFGSGLYFVKIKSGDYIYKTIFEIRK